MLKPIFPSPIFPTPYPSLNFSLQYMQPIGTCNIMLLFIPLLEHNLLGYNPQVYKELDMIEATEQSTLRIYTP